MKFDDIPLVVWFASLLFCCIASVAMGESAPAPEGAWRLELNNGMGIYSGACDRDGDYMLTGVVEYEKPLSGRLALGLRLMPLFVYEQEGRGEDTLYGGGGGLALRMYSVKNEYRGLFGELSAHALGHSNDIQGNDSHLNFLSGLGIGYQFDNPWSLSLKYDHISNAGLGGRNSGVNTLALGVGYRF